MFKPQSTLTNQKPSRGKGALAIVTPTKGIIRLNQKSAAAIGVTKGDYLSIARGEDGTLALFRGRPSDEEKGLNQVGSKLSFAGNNDGGNLQFSSANAWMEMGGDADAEDRSSVYYRVNEEAEEVDGVDYFIITQVTAQEAGYGSDEEESEEEEED